MRQYALSLSLFSPSVPELARYLLTDVILGLVITSSISLAICCAFFTHRLLKFLSFLFRLMIGGNPVRFPFGFRISQLVSCDIKDSGCENSKCIEQQTETLQSLGLHKPHERHFMLFVVLELRHVNCVKSSARTAPPLKSYVYTCTNVLYPNISIKEQLNLYLLCLPRPQIEDH